MVRFVESLGVPELGRWLAAVVLLCAGTTLGAAEPGMGNTSIQPAHRWVPAGPASVDAVTGQMELNLPVGPTLPGRIPMGFVWHSDGKSRTFDAYRWPTWDSAQPGKRIIVTLGHQKVPFLSGTPVDAQGDPLKWMQDRGLSSGQEKVGTLESGYTAYFNAKVFTSEDGNRHLIVSAWHVKAPMPPKPWNEGTVFPPPDPRVFSPRMAVVQGDTVIWTSFEDAAGENVQQAARPFLEVRNRWGDWVRLEKTLEPITGELVGGTLASSLGHSLTLSGTGTSCSITNSMGLPECQISGGITQTTFTTSGLTGSDRVITWNEQLLSIESRSGAKVEYQWTGTGISQAEGVPAPSPEAFDLDGNWKGFEPVTYIMGAMAPRKEVGVLQAAIKGVKFSSITEPTNGSYLEFIRTFPKPSTYDTNNRTIDWASTEYKTEIRFYPHPNPGDSYRFTRLIHAQPLSVFGAPADVANGWAGQSVSEQRQMVLFALSEVVQELQGTMSGSSETIQKQTTFDGWSLKGPMNPNGDVTGLVALQPKATRVVAKRMQGDGPTLAVEHLAWNGRVFQTQRQITGPSTPTAFDETGKPANAVWRGSALPESDETSGGIIRTASITATWDADLVKLLQQSSTATVGGSKYPLLRGATLADLGTKTYQHDSLGRISLITGVTGSFTSELEQIPEPGRPEIKATTRRVMGPGGPAPLSGRVGEDFEYTGLWRTKVRQRPDSRWAAEERDDLGRLTATITPDGIRTTVHYDSFGRPWKTIREAKGTVSSVTVWKEWDPSSRWVREHSQGNDGSDVVKETRLDAFGRVIAVVTAKGSTAERTVYFEYDGFGQKTRESLPTKAGATPRYSKITYDIDGFVRQTTNSRGVVTAVFTRPQAGTLDGQPGYILVSQILRRVGTTEILKTQQSLKDELGQVIRSVDTLGQLTKMTYDAFGHLKEIRRDRQTRSYSYNEIGWLLSQTQPEEEGTTDFENHTVTGQALKITKGPAGSTTTQILDLYPAGDASEGLIHTLTSTGLGMPVTSTYTYDSQRRLFTRKDAQYFGTVWETYGYDALSRLNTKTISDGTISFTVSRDFDAFGNVTKLHYPKLNGQAGRSVVRTYDALHRPSGVAFGPTNAEATVAMMAFDQTINGDEGEQLTYANSITTVWQRNADQELSRVTHKRGATVLQDAGMTWSNDGRMISRGSDAFEYDELGRLSKATISGVNGERVAQTYGYDLFGNRNSVGSTPLAGTLPNEAVGYQLDIGTNNQIPTKTVAGVATGAVYDAQGRMSRVWAIPADSTTLTTWSYDTLGRVITQGGATAAVESYLLDGAGLRFKRVKQDGTIQYRVYGFDREPLSTFEKPVAVQVKSMRVASLAGGIGGDPLPSTNATILQPSGSKTVGVGQSVAFSAGGSGTSFAWSFGDGGTATGKNVNHTFGGVGTYWVMVIVKGTGYSPSSAEVAITVVQGPSIGTFTATPAVIYQGQSSTLSWTVTPAGAGATTVSLDQGLGTQNGSWISVSPSTTRTYTLTATSPYGTATRGVTVAVNAPLPAPVISSFTSSVSTLTVGQSALLSWAVTGATSFTLNGAPVTGTSLSVSPTGTTTYTLVALNACNQAQKNLTITVMTPEPPLAWVSDAVYGWGQLILEKRGSLLLYQQGDHLGTPSVLTNSAGVVIGRQKSLPFGERIAGSGETSLRRFTNHEDGNQFPVYMQARMYLPTYGRFAQVDPAYDHSSDGLNLYSYVSNEPITRTDPDGMRDVGDGGGGDRWSHVPLQKIDPLDGMEIKMIEDMGGIYQTWDGKIHMPDPDYTRSGEWTAAGSTATQESQSDQGVSQKDAMSLEEHRRAVLMVGDPGLGRHNSGDAFMLAATTEKTALEKLGYSVDIVRVSTVQDMTKALSTGDAINKAYYFGHSSYYALHPGQAAGANSNVSASNVSQLKASKMAPGSSLTIFGCNAGRGYPNIANSISYYIKHTTHAFSSGLHFTSDPSYRRGLPPGNGPSSVPLYMRPDNGLLATPFDAYRR